MESILWTCGKTGLQGCGLVVSCGLDGCGWMSYVVKKVEVKILQLDCVQFRGCAGDMVSEHNNEHWHSFGSPTMIQFCGLVPYGGCGAPWCSVCQCCELCILGTVVWHRLIHMWYTQCIARCITQVYYTVVQWYDTARYTCYRQWYSGMTPPGTPVIHSGTVVRHR